MASAIVRLVQRDGAVGLLLEELMKTLLVAALLSGQYCGTDVPYDFIIVDDVLAIRTHKGLEECRFDGQRAACPASHDMNIDTDDGGNLVATWDGLDIPVVMPPCP